MNCQDFENIVNDLAREQIMKASVRIESLAHRDECALCARRLEDESTLSFKLRALASESRFSQAPALGDELLAAFRSHRFARGPAVNHQWRYWGAAAAAIVLAVIAVAEMRFRQVTPSAHNLQRPQITSSRETDNSATIAKAPEVVIDSPDVLPPRLALASHRPGRRSANRLIAPYRSTVSHDRKDIVPEEKPTTVATNHSTTEVTTDFIPVGYQNTINLQDGGQIVRVRLPRSALVAFGLPVNMDRYNERVKADVFFGADGMARAIRFVQ